MKPLINKNGVNQRNTLCDQKVKAVGVQNLSKRRLKKNRFWKFPDEMRTFLLYSPSALVSTSSIQTASRLKSVNFPLIRTCRVIKKSSTINLSGTLLKRLFLMA